MKNTIAFIPIKQARTMKCLSLNKRMKYLIKTKGCLACGAKIIGIEINLYTNGLISKKMMAINKQGKRIKMTIDHIFPRSKGGSNRLDNLQPMCYDCNVEKGDKV